MRGSALSRAARIVSGPRSKWIVVGAWVVLVAVFGPIGMKLNAIKADQSTALIPNGSQSAHVNTLLSKRFTGGDLGTAVIVYRTASGPLTEADRRKISSDAQRAASLPLTGPAIAPFGLGPNPAVIHPEQVSRAGNVAFTIVPLGRGHAQAVADTIKKLRALAMNGRGGLEVHVTGAPVLLNDIASAVSGADKTLLLATGLLVLALLLLIYRSPMLALVPLVVVIVAYIVAQGIVYLLAKSGLRVDNTSTSLLVVLMFGAGTDYCLLMVARYSADLRAVQDHHEALARAVPRAAPAMAASGVTVIGALLVLLLGRVSTDRALGPVNAIGIAVVLLAALTLLPALLAIVGRRGFWPAAERVAHRPGGETVAHRSGGEASPRPQEDPGVGAGVAVGAGTGVATEAGVGVGVWTRVAERVLARPVPAAFGVALLIGSGALGLLLYNQDADPVAMFRNATDGTRGYAVIKSAFPPGTVAPTTVLVQRRDGGLVTAADIASATRFLRSESNVALVAPGRVPRSRDGRIAALSLVFADNPFARPALARIQSIRARAPGALPSLTMLLGDGSAVRLDYRTAAGDDLKLIAPIVLAVVFIMLVLLLRAVVAPLYLLATVILSFFGTLGFSLLVFRLVFGQARVDPAMPIFAFIFLVALGVDYNIFLMSRVREESVGRGTREGMRRALATTGPVITSAGLILAGTFLVLTSLPIWILLEIGFAVAFGVLVDTFLVRTILVPALATIIGDRSWWPVGLPPAETPVSQPLAEAVPL
jgi:RND superfamily putative drug exporter